MRLHEVFSPFVRAKISSPVCETGLKLSSSNLKETELKCQPANKAEIRHVIDPLTEEIFDILERKREYNKQ